MVKTIIYQYWDGNLLPGVEFSRKNISEYAKRIGSEYRFEHNPRWVTNLGKYSPHYGQFKVVYDESFNEYDKILFLDSDVYAVEGLNENVFEGFDQDLGICEETWQPKNRVKMNGDHISNIMDEKWCKAIKEKWNKEMPRTEDNLPRVFNSGVVLYTRHGIEKMKKNFIPFKEYVSFIRSKGLPDFYTCDQPYIHAMLEVADLDYKIMDSGWNSFIHGYYKDGKGKKIKSLNDMRTSTTKLVHVQLSGADHFSEDTLYRIVNNPPKEWNVPIPNYTKEWSIE